MKRYTFKIKAGETSTYGIVGKYVYIFSAEGDLEIHTNKGDIIVLPQQMGWTTREIFESISFLSSVSQTIIFYAGWGEIVDNRTSLVGDVVNQGGVLLLNTYDVKLLADKNPERKSLIISNTVGNGLNIYAGNSDVPGNNKLIVHYNDSLQITQGAKSAWYVQQQRRTPYDFAVNGTQVKFTEVF